MKYQFDEIIDRRHDPRSYSMKWSTSPFLAKLLGVDQIQDNSIAMCTADMDFRCAQPIVDALIETAQYGIYGYSCTFDTPEYNQSIIDWFQKRRGWTIHPEELMFSPGTLSALKAFVQAFTAPDDGVIIQTPVYGPFSNIIRQAGRQVVVNPLIDNEGYYTMDFEDLEKKAACGNVKLMFLCNPHNPVGRVWTPEELSRVGEICKKNGVILVSDEVHGDLVRRGVQFTPAASVVPGEGVIACTAINKTFNVAGLACTNLVIPNPALREAMNPFLGFEMPSPFGIAATIAAYRDGEEWLEQVIDYVDENIDFALDFLARRMPKARCRKPEGTYILWLDLRGYGLSADEIHRRIYQEAQVMLEGGSMFDPVRGDGYERICVPTPRAVLEQALERIAQQLEV